MFLLLKLSVSDFDACQILPTFCKCHEKISRDHRSDLQISGVLRNSLKTLAGSVSIPSLKTIEILNK